MANCSKAYILILLLTFQTSITTLYGQQFESDVLVSLACMLHCPYIAIYRCDNNIASSYICIRSKKLDKLTEIWLPQ